MVDRVAVGDELIIDWDNLDFDLGEFPPSEGFSTSPDSGCSFSIDDIEQYLLNDESFQPAEEKDGLADEFVSNLLVECFPGWESGSDGIKDCSAIPESVDVVTDEEKKEREKPQEKVADVLQTKEDCAADDDGDGDADDDATDPDGRKRKRQMRNRDAAVRSRERKKMYVRELEMKSKYYEAECKRLGILLQCCLAENQGLRLSLHNSKAFDASRSKQESAVLVLESLLLGSLLWFLGIIYLLILPSQLVSTLEASLLKNVDSTECRSVALRKAGNKNFMSLFPSYMMGKGCKASRSRMKLRLYTTEVSRSFCDTALCLVSY